MKAGAIDTTFMGAEIPRKDRFIYCLAGSIDKKMFETWDELENYDYVIKINNVLEFACAIEKADRAAKSLLGILSQAL